MVEFPAVRHKGAVTDSMERAALLTVVINPRPHSLKN